MAEGSKDSAPKLAAKKRRLVLGSDSESGSDSDFPFSPQLRMQNEGMAPDEIKHEGYQDFQDIAEVYGHQSDALGETWEEDDTEDLGDSVFCAICDDGGHLLFCDGPCMRSFHASEGSASRSAKCKSLGLKEEHIEKVESWYCPNCKHGQQQCFICGRLGKSEGEDKQVFVCDVALCGRFYHPLCLGDWKVGERFNGIVDRKAFVKRVEGGDGFCCPAHSCRACGEGEEEGADNKFAKCRRCPKAFHEHCLPKKHEIDESLKTPARTHLKWPQASSLYRKHQQMEKAPSLKPNYQRSTEASSLKQNHKDAFKAPSLKQSYRELLEDPSLDREMDMTRSLFKADQRTRTKISENKLDRTNKIFNRIDSSSPTVLLRPHGTMQLPVKAPPTTNVSPLLPSSEFQRRMGPEKKFGERRPPFKNILISREGQRTRISLLMQQATDLVTLEDVRKVLVEPSCYQENQEKYHGHRGEIMSTLHAGRKALDVLKQGGQPEDAKRLFPKDSLVRLLRIERSLGVYLAPFVHGIRYTSFGRHFTNVGKLQEIVDRIHPYIDSGDMMLNQMFTETSVLQEFENGIVVDFCCGANDFSILLSTKLIRTWKNCEFRNFDILPPKERFCFTQGDWLKTDGHDFLDGSRLIMGLNPPFGYRASLADKFILHALKFRPKLLVLIVPPETMSFAERYKTFDYDLVWRDNELLKGNAFFIPGSVGERENENISQWNNTTPPLYLWSRGDMLGKHKSIARSCGHIRASPGDFSESNFRREPQQVLNPDQLSPGFRSHFGEDWIEDRRRFS